MTTTESCPAPVDAGGEGCAGRRLVSEVVRDVGMAHLLTQKQGIKRARDGQRDIA